jgi:peptidase E
MIKFVLIGGKKNKEILTNNIEKYIINLSGKNNPKILFCPYATSDYKKTNLKFKNLINNLSADVYYMDENDINNFDKLLNEADILYVSGGNCNRLVDIFINNGLDRILLKYINSNKIYAGSSAGAMLYTNISMGDKDMYSDNYHNYGYKMVKCLNIINISICPHYQNEDLICYNDEIKNYNLVSFGIEEDSAIVIDGKMFYSIKEESTSMAFYFNNKDYKMTYLKEKKIYEEDFCIRS